MDEDSEDKYLKAKQRRRNITLDTIYILLGLTLSICSALLIIEVLKWYNIPPTPSSTPHCQVQKCVLNSDVIDVQFVLGVTNITKVCYYGSSQIIYSPPTDPLNFDFGTASFNSAFTVCKRSIAQKFTYWPAITPYMANDPTSSSNGVYTRCELVFDCSFDRYVSFLSA